MENIKVSLACFLTALICILPTAVVTWASDLDPFAGQSGTLRIAGGTAHIPVMQEAAKRIISFNPKIRISIGGGGSGLGIRQVGEGLIDIGNAGRRPTDQEIDKYGLQLFRWAVDGVAAVVHPNNPVRELSSKQLRGIFSGRITNWKEVGGPDHAITLYTRDEASGTRKVFWKKALAKEPITASANVVVSNGAMKTATANDPFAIGYVSVGYLDDSVAPITLDGVLPSLENVRTGKYPVARGLYSLTRGEPKGLARLFLDFLFSPTGQQIIADKGFIPVPKTSEAR